MKRYFRLIACLSFSVLTLSSCEEWLEEDPIDFIGPSMLTTDDVAAKYWVTGAYNKFCTELFIWGNWPRGIELDNDYITGPDWALKDIGSGNFLGTPSQQADPIWKGPYRIINAANGAIEAINGMDGVTERYKENALGELYTMKAWAYFVLTRAFGEVPVFYTSISEGADPEQPRQPIPVVYEHIVDLLTKAKDMCYKNTDSAWESYHISAGTAAGLLAKVYVTMASGSLESGTVTVRTGKPFEMIETTKVLVDATPQTFTKTVVKGYESFNAQDCFKLARDMAKDVMDGVYGDYELVPYADLWKKDRDQREHMWVHQAISGHETFGTLYAGSYCGTEDSDGYIYTGLNYGCRDHWYKLFESQDLRIVDGVMHQWKRQGEGKRGEGSYYPDNAEYRLKATGKNMNGEVVSDPVAPYNDGYKYSYNVTEFYLAYNKKYYEVSDRKLARTDASWSFLRYADVVLIFAEAENELNYPSNAAMSALNDVRKRSLASEKSYSGVEPVTSKDMFRSAVLEERAMEFACEADRRWDLIRWGIYLDAMNAIGGVDECGNLKTRSNKHLLFPIPVDEMNANSKITENNPGW